MVGLLPLSATSGLQESRNEGQLLGADCGDYMKRVSVQPTRMSAFNFSGSSIYKLIMQNSSSLGKDSFGGKVDNRRDIDVA